jgi:hypothetical protein
MFNTLLHNINEYRARRLSGTSAYREALADLPVTLYPCWKRRACYEFKGIPQDAFFFALAAEGLLMFFECVARSGKPCALPSKAADSVWHAWAQMSPAGLDKFCLKHFGRTIPHVEAAAMEAQMEDALANCLVQARQLAGLPTAGVGLPQLFALDRKLKMPGGFGYRMVAGQVAFSHMDRHGKPVGDVFYPSRLGPVELLMAGLISQAAYDAYVQRAKSEGTSAGVACGTVACDTGGSACGSGCGGD